MAPMERQKFRRQGLFSFFQSLTAGYKLPGIVRKRATSFSAVQLVQGFCFVVFRILSVTGSLTRAFSQAQSLAHAQQLFSASMRMPGQILGAEGLHFSAFHIHSNWLG